MYFYKYINCLDNELSKSKKLMASAALWEDPDALKLKKEFQTNMKYVQAKLQDLQRYHYIYCKDFYDYPESKFSHYMKAPYYKTLLCMELSEADSKILTEIAVRFEGASSEKFNVDSNAERDFPADSTWAMFFDLSPRIQKRFNEEYPDEDCLVYMLSFINLKTNKIFDNSLIFATDCSGDKNETKGITLNEYGDNIQDLIKLVLQAIVDNLNPGQKLNNILTYLNAERETEADKNESLERITPSYRENRKRLKKGKTPIPEYTLLKIPKRYAESLSNYEKVSGKKARHWRRAHYRRLEKKVIWIRPCLINKDNPVSANKLKVMK